MMMMMLVPCVCVNRKCAVIKRFRRFVVEKASSSFPLFSSVFWQPKPKNRENQRSSFFSFFTKKNSVHSLTMADVQHERGYQKQVGVNVG
jgi:hypothetical protein